ncbi:MAG: hypothetical protein U0525_04195 [Patescibacteria group bacterium]
MNKAFVIVFVICLLVAVFSLGFVIEKQTKISKKQVSSKNVIYVAAQNTPTPTTVELSEMTDTPTPIRFPSSAPTPTIKKEIIIQTSSYDSPDGSKELILKKQKTEEEMKYAGTVIDKKSGDSNVILDLETTMNREIYIPYNAWSPDNLFVFLNEREGDINRFFVVSATGKNFGDGSASIDITVKFQEKLPDYILEDVTGWAAPYLLIVNAKNIDGTQGPSFWFDVSTQSFMQLWNRFN